MRLLADTNIPAHFVQRARSIGFDVIYSAERETDPGDAALLDEALREQRILVTKDTDFGSLVFRDAAPHAGVLLIDDLGDPQREGALLLDALHRYREALKGSAFLRVTANGVRFAQP